MGVCSFWKIDALHYLLQKIFKFLECIGAFLTRLDLVFVYYSVGFSVWMSITNTWLASKIRVVTLFGSISITIFPWPCGSWLWVPAFSGTKYKYRMCKQTYDVLRIDSAVCDDRKFLYALDTIFCIFIVWCWNCEGILCRRFKKDLSNFSYRLIHRKDLPNTHAKHFPNG